MGEPCLTRDAMEYTEVVSRCCDCQEKITETIPRVAAPYHRARCRCHRCLAVYFQKRGCKVARGAEWSPASKAV